MPATTPTARQRLKAFDLKALFLEDLGWDHCPQVITITASGKTFSLSAIAKKHGMVAYTCAPPDGDSHAPDRNVRLAIDRQLTQTTYEHLLVFTDKARTLQIWQWVRREPGKPIACREHKYETSQPGDHLLEKLQQLAVSLEEDERGLSIADIARRVRSAFDVEKVTKRFYEHFKKEKDEFTKVIDGIPIPEDKRWYASVMLNRLMFVYFLQRKGFLDGDPQYLRSRLAACKEERGKNQFYSFYRHFLLRLFQEGLGQRPPRKAGLDKLLGRIPYLNGGIFDIHTLETESRYGPKIEIPDSAFERIFNYFDRYDWTLDSTRRPRRPEDKEEINPEILGYIFEKYINQKEMGAYYTQDDITEYIGKSTIIPFLFDAARARCEVAFQNPAGPTVWNLLQSNPDRYIYPAIRHGITWRYAADHPTKGEPLENPVQLPPEIAAGLDTTNPDLIKLRKPWNKSSPPEFALPTETWREVVARRQHHERIRADLAAGNIKDINTLVTLNLDLRQFAQDVIETAEGPDLLMAFWHAISSITVLDPTGGSGAFVFAALNVLEPLYEACLERMEGFLAEWGDKAKKLHPNFHKWFTEILGRIEKHPNRRYFILKSIIVNNLYAVDIMEEAVEICKLRLFLKLAAQVAPKHDDPNLGIEPLPDIDFNVRAGNTLVGYASAEEVRRCMKSEKTSGADQMRLGVETGKDAYGEFEEQLLQVDAAFRTFREQQTELGGAVTAEDKRELQKRLTALERKLNSYLARDYRIQTTNDKQYGAWLRTHKPFHWLIEFYAIMAKGGFDVILGNPPYVEYKEVRKDYQIRNYRTEECGNLYAFCWERAVALSHTASHLGLIIPVASVCTDGYAALRNVWLGSGSLVVSNFNDRPGKLFDGLEHIRLAIVLLHKQKDGSRTVHTTTYNKWQTEARPQLFQSLRYTETTALVRSGSMPKVGSPVEASILSKVQSSPKTLQHFASSMGRHRIYYTRKLSWFVQILDFIPAMTGDDGQKREPSELKEVKLADDNQRAAFLCALNSTLFYWLLTVWSDCRNLNKREVLGMPLDYAALATEPRAALAALAYELMEDFRKNSKTLEMDYEDWGRMRIQCIYPKFSKPILDRIDKVLADHYALTPEETEFILNYDIKFRLGADAQAETEATAQLI